VSAVLWEPGYRGGMCQVLEYGIPFMRQDILIIIPAYNEAEALGTCVEGLCRDVSGADVLVVNDGSIDDTARIAEALAVRLPAVRVLHLPLNSGIGAAVQSGLIYAARNGYAAAIQYDGDGQHDARFIPAMLAAVHDQQLDLVIGTRFLDMEGDAFKSTFMRRIGIRFFSFLIGMLTGVKVTDPTSGFRVYGRRAVEFFARHYPDDYPEPEALFWCVRNGLRVGEVAVRMRERQGGVSSIRYFRTAYYMIKVTLAILVDRLRAREVVDDEG